MTENEKTKAILRFDLLKITWLNFKNSKDIFYHSLRNIPDPSINDALRVFDNDLKDADKIIDDISFILEEFDQEFLEINKALMEQGAPSKIISSDQFSIKYQWSMNQMENNIYELQQLNVELEDQQTSLERENQSIHREFKDFTARMQPLIDEKERIFKDLENNKILMEEMEEKLANTEDDYNYTKTIVEDQNKQISKLKTRIRKLKVEILKHDLLNVATPVDKVDQDNKGLSNTHLHPTVTDSRIRVSSTNKDSSKRIYQCINCPSMTKTIMKLTKDLKDIHNKYSSKREQHRQKLLQARSLFLENKRELSEQNLAQKESIDNLLEKSKLLEIRLNNAIKEKNQLTSRLIPIEDDLTNVTNNYILGQHKIHQLENLVQQLKDNIRQSR